MLMMSRLRSVHRHTFSAAENQTAIGTVTATDVDTDNSVYFLSLSLALSYRSPQQES